MADLSEIKIRLWVPATEQNGSYVLPTIDPTLNLTVQSVSKELAKAETNNPGVLDYLSRTHTLVKVIPQAVEGSTHRTAIAYVAPKQKHPFFSGVVAMAYQAIGKPFDLDGFVSEAFKEYNEFSGAFNSGKDGPVSVLPPAFYTTPRLLALGKSWHNAAFY